jgi:hypothetical protein
MLKLQTIYKRLDGFAEKVAGERAQLSALPKLLDALFSPESEFIKAWRRFPESLQSTIAAGLIESPSVKKPTPQRPNVLTLCSADGSQIYPNRMLNFCLLNFSQICFHIGVEEPPFMETYSKFYDAETFFSDFFRDGAPGAKEDSARETGKGFIAPEQVNALRQVKELSALLHVAKERRVANRPILAIADGTLICWAIKNQPSLLNEYVQKIAEFRKSQIPIVAYKSSPETQSVAKALAHLAADDLAHFQISDALLTDLNIFNVWLQKGERSAVFQSRSDIVEARYHNSDKIYFFYLHTGREIARIEFPAWVFEAQMVDFIHAALMDDLTKGKGYPMTLTEAHEHAVVKKSEEAQFFELLEKRCLTRGVAISDSAKTASKRVAVI